MTNIIQLHTMTKFNRHLWKQFWDIAKPYWFSEEKWKARGMIALLVLLLLGRLNSMCCSTSRPRVYLGMAQRMRTVLGRDQILPVHSDRGRADLCVLLLCA